MHAYISDRTDRTETRYELARDVNGSRSDVDLAMLELAEREARAILAETEPGPLELYRHVAIGHDAYMFEEVIQAALADALTAFVNS